jgi:hypothetical protein
MAIGVITVALALLMIYIYHTSTEDYRAADNSKKIFLRCNPQPRDPGTPSRPHYLPQDADITIDLKSGRPPCLAGGIIGSTSAHSASVSSLG